MAKNVGIVSAEIYFPSTYVNQTELEKFDGVAEGKYTVGLGQKNMAVCSPREDINSICLTVVQSLMEKWGVDYRSIGRLEVGTETLVDKSKSVKSTLMTLFQAHGNTNIEGIDTINACYGGTAALFNSIAWVESSAWDGRYAIVVCGDIAVYERGPARPTGGAGVVAMLIGPNAPLVLEPGIRGTHMEHAFDFYKPIMNSEYPLVDGKLSNTCYIRALDNCYLRYGDKFAARFKEPFTIDKFDFAVFHQPYEKLVQKSLARFFYLDYMRNPSPALSAIFAPFKDLTLEQSYESRDLEKASLAAAKETYTNKVAPSTYIGRECGNMYCGSVYAGLLSLVSQKASDLTNKRVLMFSYGSGLAASMFSFKVEKDVTELKQKLNVEQRLAQRTKLAPEVFTELLEQREKTYTAINYEVDGSLDHIAPGTYYLNRVDHLARRSYERKPFAQKRGYHTLSKPLQQRSGTLKRGLKLLRKF